MTTDEATINIDRAIVFVEELIRDEPQPERWLIRKRRTLLAERRAIVARGVWERAGMMDPRADYSDEPAPF